MTEDLSHAVKAATYLREKGIRTMLHCEDKKFKAKLSYADKLKIPFAVFIGEDEIKSGMPSLKNLDNGQQVACTIERLADVILNTLKKSEALGVIREKDI
jgi:histidyl-tRNA synthetase